MNKIIALIIILICFTSITFAGALTASIEVVFNKVNIAVNGQKVEADNILYDGTTYVPLRKVAEILGKEVSWDEGTNTAGINNKGQSILNAGDGFIYKNTSFKQSTSIYAEAIGEMTNTSGKDYDYAFFTLSVYDENGALLETSSINIKNLKNNETKSFSSILQTDKIKIKTYKIQFESGM
ncbi:MAG TPA: hypothetical protein DEP72_03745 [Clostridiales bacterium]|nr:MAG: hypothetical protein A2Y18_05325 [Clostridiales bacterium GWD2_32_19]HCC07267.1 hypothetical protein [Clostridiales bacterium]